MKLALCFMLALFPAILCSCSDGGPGSYPLDRVLTLSEVQAKGTHNSYHLEPDNPVDPSHEYSHAPLQTQLSQQGVRQFELDLHYRTGVGFEIFHLPAGVDQETSCLLLTDCMQAVLDWSDDNPDHLPILIWLEPKDDLDLTDPGLELLGGHFDDLEDEILSVVPRTRVLTPDEVRGTWATLPQSISEQGWPALGELRGKLIFSMLDSGAHRQEYLGSGNNLEGKLMFVGASAADEPFAAMFKINDAQREGDRVAGLVQAGFIVTSNGDSVEDSDQANEQKVADSWSAGVHFLSSDFPAPVSDRDYWMQLPQGQPARCNPQRQPEECTPADIENLKHSR